VANESTKTILVVDDDENIRDVIAQFTRGRGYNAVEAAGGQEAIDIVTTGNVDLIILDVMMPGMDGFTTLTKIRECGVNTPVVMLTAKSLDDDVMRGYSVGADFYLVKPVSMETLRKVIDYLIGDLSPEQRTALEQEI